MTEALTTVIKLLMELLVKAIQDEKGKSDEAARKEAFALVANPDTSAFDLWKKHKGKAGL